MTAVPKILLNTIAVSILLGLQAQSVNAQATDLAICQNLDGHAYYHNRGLVKAKDAGWSKDRISKGKTVLKRLAPGKYDVLVLDASGSIWSAIQDGGTVFGLRATSTEITVMHVSKAAVIEIYNFYKERDGAHSTRLFS